MTDPVTQGQAQENESGAGANGAQHFRMIWERLFPIALLAGLLALYAVSEPQTFFTATHSAQPASTTAAAAGMPKPLPGAEQIAGDLQLPKNVGEREMNFYVEGWVAFASKADSISSVKISVGGQKLGPLPQLVRKGTVGGENGPIFTVVGFHGWMPLHNVPNGKVTMSAELETAGGRSIPFAQQQIQIVP